jgi:hypothetical protein
MGAIGYMAMAIWPLVIWLSAIHNWLLASGNGYGYWLYGH